MDSWLTPLIILIVLLFILAAWSTWLTRRFISFWQAPKNIQPSLNNLEGECND